MRTFMSGNYAGGEVLPHSSQLSIPVVSKSGISAYPGNTKWQKMHILLVVITLKSFRCSGSVYAHQTGTLLISSGQFFYLLITSLL